MRKLTFLAAMFCLFGLGNIANAQIVNIPDANFKAALVGNASINTNGDGEIQSSEAAAFTGEIKVSYSSISDLTGIIAFTALTGLDCYGNQLTSLNVSTNTALTKLYCHNNQLTSLNLSANTSLNILGCSNNKLSSLNLSYNTTLTVLGCSNNQLSSLNLSTNNALKILDCDGNQLSSLNLSTNNALKNLDCGSNQLISLDLSANTALTYLNCSYNQLTSLNVSSNTALASLNCWNNQFTSLDISANTVMTGLSCSYNQLTSLNLSANTALTYLRCSDNQLTSLNVKNGNNTNFTYFYANNNPNLTCINVDDSTWSTANWTNKDAGASFSENCYADITELINTTEIKTYPNPTTGKLAVSVSSGNISSIEIYNLTGEKVYEKNFNQQKPALSKVEGSTEIDISNSPCGIYFLKVGDGDKVYTSKIVVQ